MRIRGFEKLSAIQTAEDVNGESNSLSGKLGLHRTSKTRLEHLVPVPWKIYRVTQTALHRDCVIGGLPRLSGRKLEAEVGSFYKGLWRSLLTNGVTFKEDHRTL